MSWRPEKNGQNTVNPDKTWVKDSGTENQDLEMIFWRKIELFLPFRWYCLFLGGISIRPRQANHWFKTVFVKGWVVATLLFRFDIPWMWTCGIFSYRKKVTPLKDEKEGHRINRGELCNLDHNSFLIQTFLSSLLSTYLSYYICLKRLMYCLFIVQSEAIPRYRWAFKLSSLDDLTKN